MRLFVKQNHDAHGLHLQILLEYEVETTDDLKRLL